MRVEATSKYFWQYASYICMFHLVRGDLIEMSYLPQRRGWYTFYLGQTHNPEYSKPTTELFVLLKVGSLAP